MTRAPSEPGHTVAASVAVALLLVEDVVEDVVELDVEDIVELAVEDIVELAVELALLGIAAPQTLLFDEPAPTTECI